jgi:hypothetical protein
MPRKHKQLPQQPRPPRDRLARRPRLRDETLQDDVTFHHPMEHSSGDAGATNDILVVSLCRYYLQRNKQNMARILPYITCKSGISLRLIDWFVTNYAKKNNTIITRKHNNNVIHFNVYLSYRMQLKAYSKQQFDPFRRRDRIMLYYDIDKPVETTVGQLNFFRWMLQNDVIDFVHENAPAIEADMVASQKEASTSSPARASPVKKGSSKAAASKQSPVTRKKRTEISRCKATNTMTRMVGERVVSFE